MSASRHPRPARERRDGGDPNSDRQRVLAAVERVCGQSGRPVRSGEVTAALADVPCTISSPRVTRALGSLAATGHLHILGHSFGLRSGGRCLYWPAHGPRPWAGASATTLMARVVACLGAHPEWRRGRPFTAREVTTALGPTNDSADPHPDPATSWSGVYVALRNFELRQHPLVQRLTTTRGAVTWRWIGEERKQASLPNNRNRRQRARPITSDHAVTHAGRGPTAERGRADSYRVVEEAVLREMHRSGCALVSVVSLLDTVMYAPDRDALRAHFRRVLHQEGHMRREPPSPTTRPADASPHPVRVAGWLTGRAYVYGGAALDSGEALMLMRGLEAQRQLHSLTQQVRFLSSVPASAARAAAQGIPDVEDCHAEAAQTVMARAASLASPLARALRHAPRGRPWHRALADATVELSMLESSLEQSASRANGNGRATAPGTMSPVQCVCTERGRSGARAGDAVGRVETSAGPTQCQYALCISERSEFWSAELLHHVLCELVGPHLPGSVLLRRRLRTSPTWREWARTPCPLTSPELQRDAGREPVLWARTEALLWLGLRFGGPHTRLALRAARHLAPWGELTRDQARAVARVRNVAWGLAGRAYHACAVGITRSPERAIIDHEVIPELSVCYPWLAGWAISTTASLHAALGTYMGRRTQTRSQQSVGTRSRGEAASRHVPMPGPWST